MRAIIGSAFTACKRSGSRHRAINGFACCPTATCGTTATAWRTCRRQEALIASLDVSFYQDPSLLWNAQPGTGVPVTVNVVGTQLTIQPAAGFVGSFSVQVSATDSIATSSRTFAVSVTNTAPSLGTMISQPQSQSQDQTPGALVFTVPVADADKDTVTLSAQAIAFNQTAYMLENTIGFLFTGTYETGAWGNAEKWLKGKDGHWYCLLPNGELRQGRSNMNATLQPDALIATLDPAFYNDPSLLWNAQTPVAPRVTVVVQGNQLTVTPAGGYRGTFYVEVTASDGFTTTTRAYLLTV